MQNLNYSLKRLFLFILFCLYISNMAGQNIGFSGNINRNCLFGYKQEGNHFESKESPGYGFSFGSCIYIKMDSFMPLKIFITLDNYKGKIYIKYGDLGSSSETDATFDKYTLGIGIYPGNFKIFKKVQIGVGGECNFLIHNNTTGYHWSSIAGIGTYTRIGKDSLKIDYNLIFGLSCQISYDLKISNSWFISPFYKFYLGMTGEFNIIDGYSIRQSLGIAFMKQL